MDEFVKTKIGFTVALLATLFALKPLVDAYGHVGFLFFDLNITIKYAYFAITAFLGMAVYFISLQFISTKQISLFDKISDISYALSLSIPVIFITLWILVLIGGWLSKVLTDVPEVVWNVLAGVIAGVLANILTATLSKAIKNKDAESKQEDTRRKELDILSRAERLIEEGHYDLSLLEAGKIMELALRQAVTLSTGESKMYSMHNLIQRAHKLNLVSESDLEQINIARVLRNNATHLDSKVTKEEAQNALAVAKRLIKTLAFARDIAGYNWLRVNRSEALRALEGRNENLLKTVSSHLWDAWVNRDGAVSGEIADFFAASLQHNPQPIIDMFKKDELQFESWLNQLDTQMFTDFIGGQSEHLEYLRKAIIDNLKKYIEVNTNVTDKALAERIVQIISLIKVREID